MRWMRDEGRALHADLGPAGLQDRRQVQVLGRPHGRGLGRRPGPGRGCTRRSREKQGIDDRLRRARAVADRRRRRRHGRARSSTTAAPSRCTRKCVVLAAGGFEANAEMRTRYLGPGWELAKVRGTPLQHRRRHPAWRSTSAPCRLGNWSGCHAVGWDRNAPEFGDLAVGDNFQKHSYPWGIMINADGERFVDEGADFRNYTYAKYGRVILKQPGQFAWQVFDGKIIPMLRDEYRIKQVTKVSRRHARGAGRQARRRRRRQRSSTTIKAYNAAVQHGRAVQSQRQGRPRHRRPRGQQVELGEHHRSAAVRGLRGDLRHHLHLRRPQDRHRARAWSIPTARRSPASTRRASWSAASSTSTIRAAPGLMAGAVFGRIAGATAGRRAASNA